jgi:hypothetical protein
LAPPGFVLPEYDPGKLPDGRHAFRARLELAPGQPKEVEAAVGQATAASRLADCYAEVAYYTGLSNGVGPAGLTPPQLRQSLVVSLFHGHDAHVAVSRGGQILFVLELERLLGIRYFDACHFMVSNSGQFQDERKVKIEAGWAQAGAVVRGAAGLRSGELFNVGVFQTITYDLAYQQLAALHMAMRAVPAKCWVQVSHHHSHATLGVWDAHLSLGLRRPVVVSFDGGGDDGTTTAFWGNVDGDSPRTRALPLNLDDEASPDLGGGGGGEESGNGANGLSLGWSAANFGMAYEGVAAVLPEVSRNLYGTCLKDMGLRGLALAGKMMGYSALGNVRPEWLPALRAHFRAKHAYPAFCAFDTAGQLSVASSGGAAAPAGSRNAAVPIDPRALPPLPDARQAGSAGAASPARRVDQRDLAATAQAAMEEATVALVRRALAAATRSLAFRLSLPKLQKKCK